MHLFIGDSMIKSGYLFDTNSHFISFPGLRAKRAVAELQNELPYLQRSVESITLLLGTNDLAQGADVHSIVDSIFRTVKWCFSVYGTHIYIIIPLPRVDAKMQQLWELEQLLIAGTKIEPMPFVSFINISTDINPLDTPGLYRSSIVRHDMVHLTSEVYRKMFALIKNIKGTFFLDFLLVLKRVTR